MAGQQQSLDQQVDAVAKRFSESIEIYVNDIEVELARMLGGQTLDGPAAEHLVALAHQLAGNAPTLGFPELGRAAAELATEVEALREAGTEIDPEVRSRVIELGSTALRLAAQEENGSPLKSLVSNPPQEGPARIDDDAAAPVLHMAAVDPALTEELAEQLRQFGYTLHMASGETDSLIGEPMPAAVIIEAELGKADDDGDGLDMLAELRASVDSPPPAVIIARNDDFQARLRAVRAGAKAFLTPPVDVTRLVQVLDRLTARDIDTPYRVLVVDDDASMALMYRLLMESAGLKVTTVTDPMKVMQPLVETQPDVVVMDIAMPGCTGLELAAVIRQREEFFQTPIIFLTGQTGFDSEVLALRGGGDDFFTKPVAPEVLVSSVAARAERARRLDEMIARDSMTGLANHSRTKEQLATEVKRALRQGQPLAFAMLDLDHFKLVNDTHGHWAGDGVIKSLSQILRQRLRRTDFIGRYGGEEFAVILPDTSPEAAAEVIDEIRTAFGRIVHHADDETFCVTFSAGIAGCPPIEDAEELSRAADEALYAAKEAGRDRVERHPPAGKDR